MKPHHTSRVVWLLAYMATGGLLVIAAYFGLRSLGGV